MTSCGSLTGFGLNLSFTAEKSNNDAGMWVFVTEGQWKNSNES